MVDQSATAELGVKVELGLEHPVVGFMWSFVDEMAAASPEMEPWEVQRHNERERVAVEQRVDRFIGWFEDTWYELDAENAITDTRFKEEVDMVKLNGHVIMRHRPTGLQVSVQNNENEYAARSRLQGQVMDRFEVWREAGNPLAEMEGYRMAIHAEAESRCRVAPATVE